MRTHIAAAAAALRNPEHTGADRCLPCTAVNVGLSVAVGGLVALFSPVAGVAALLASLAAVYVRGYLVPGTPRLTKRYLPERVLARFDAHAEPPTVPSAPDEGDADASETTPEEVLTSMGVVEPCDDADDLRLTDAVGGAWRDHLDDVAEPDARRAQLADALDVAPDELLLGEEMERPHLVVEGRTVESWISEAAFVTDLAFDRTVAETDERWTELPLERRFPLLKGLRPFVERCPSCEGPVTMGEEVVESCCRSWDVVALDCDDCGARLLEVSPESAGSAAPDQPVNPETRGSFTR